MIERENDRDIFSSYRKSLCINLPKLLNTITTGYIAFASSIPSDDAKEYATYQSACRSALTHVQLLVRLAEWAQGTHHFESDEQDQMKTYEIIKEAKLSLLQGKPQLDL